jgi:L-malate glycosyltransferase
MRVLFLLSCLEPAGSETYCVALEKAWAGRHQVFWISDQLHFGQTYTSFPIHQKAFPGGLLNTFRVLRFVKENGIEVIHSHSRRAHWVGAQVAKLAKIPHVTTIHQPPPVHFFSKLFPCLGDHTIAIDEAVQDHLRKHFSRGIRKLNLIRNGIALQPAAPSAVPDNRMVILGRVTGGRWKALLFFLDVLKRSAGTFPRTHFQIVGYIPNERIRELQEQVSEVNPLIRPSFIDMHKFVTDLPSFIAGCKGVIAGGRSALESLALGRPVIALGEKGVVGLCTEETWPEATRTNFGDHYESAGDAFYPAKLEVGLRQILEDGLNRDELGHWGRTRVAEQYDIQMVAVDIDKVYQRFIKR